MAPSVLIPVAPGTNRDGELALAFRSAGANTSQVPLESLRRGEVEVADHQILALPGGFSYGDALGAGQLLGLDLTEWWADELHQARQRGMPIIGICNGFQALVRAGLLPGRPDRTATGSAGARTITDTSTTGATGDARPGGAGSESIRASLAENENGRFECRWVDLLVGSAPSPWLDRLEGPLRCPVAHGEGRFLASDLPGLEAADRVAFRYATGGGEPARGRYPANPNGSMGDVAGIVDATGLVLGLMPHPEDHVFERQDPARRSRHRPGRGGSCRRLFEAGVAAVGGP